MGVSINVNKKTQAHKGSMGIAKATLPDVCKTPTPGGPVPIPYPVLISMSNTLKKGTKKVKTDGKKAAVKGSQFSRSNGDEPGTLGGIVSSTNMKEAKWITFSFNVKMEGKNACRLTDKMTMNHNNTVCLAGELQPPLPPIVAALNEIAEKCNEQVNKDAGYSKTNKPSGKECTYLGTKKHKCCEDAIKANSDPPLHPHTHSEVPYDKKGKLLDQDTAGARAAADQAFEAAKASGKNTKGVWANTFFSRSGADLIADVVIVKDPRKPPTKDNIRKVYDFKFNCADEPSMSNSQKKKYKDALGKKPALIHAY